MFRQLRRTLLVLSAAGVLAGAVAAASASPALAYGKANWQITFSGTATNQGSGFGYGFWGWCDFAGNVSSGTNGDCEESQYVHVRAGGGFTCQLSLDLSAWEVGANGDFFVTGTATVRPTRLIAPCLAFFPGSASFTKFDYGIPAAPGHYNLGGIGGVVGEFQVTVTQIK